MSKLTPCWAHIVFPISVFSCMVACLPCFGDATTLAASTVNVKDFGAKGDGAADDAPAINRALAAAVQHGPGTILFLPAGTYAIGERNLFTTAKHGGVHLAIAHADGLTIQGEAGTRLVCRDLTRSFFSVEQSRNVTIQNFTVDADPLPFTQGTITAYDPATRNLDLQIDEGYDDIDRADLATVSEFRLCDSPYSDGWKEDQYFPKLKNRARLGPGHWRLTPASSPPYRFDASLVGKKWMLWAKGYRGWAFHIGRSDGCLIDNVRIYETGGSGGFELVNNGSATISHVYLGPPPNSNRLFCGGGGAMSFFNRGTITVEDCDFSHIDDDGFNLGTHFVRVVEKIDPRTCRTEAWPADFQVGDTLVLWDWKNKTERDEAKLTAAEKESDGHWRLNFDRPLEFVTMGEGQPTAPHKVQEVDGIDRLVDLDSAGSCILRRNRISSLRARCFLVKTGKSVIEDNLFHDTHMPGILAGAEFFWGEGPALRGLVIRRNVFRNIDAPNISVATFNSPTGISNRDVTIEDNTFEDYGRFPVVYMSKDPQGVAIQVHNTDGVTIKGNHIAPPGEGCPKVDPIVVGTCRNVQVNP